MNSFSFSIVLIAWVACSFIGNAQGDSLSTDDSLPVQFTQMDSLSVVIDTIHDISNNADSIFLVAQGG